MMAVIDLGSFGGYIWTSYGFAALSLGWLAYTSWQKTKMAAEKLADLQKKQPNNTA